jgi:hypothetical protein
MTAAWGRHWYVRWSSALQSVPSEEAIGGGETQTDSQEARRWFVAVVFWGKKNVTGTPTVLLLFNAVQIGVRRTGTRKHCPPILTLENGGNTRLSLFRIRGGFKFIPQAGRAASFAAPSYFSHSFVWEHTHKSLLFCY